MTLVLSLCSILLMPFLSEAQQKEAPATQTRPAPRDPGRQDAPRQQTCHELSPAERQELEKDIQKMRVLIGQMQQNLAAAATGESPLKRQFQLDIEMWQLLVQRMERRLVTAPPVPARVDKPSRPVQVEVIRRDQLAVLSLDNGRTRVLYTSSLGESGSVGYRELGPLIVFAYDEVQPGSGFKLHAHENVEVITIVLEGSLDHEDTAGNLGRVNTGEVALMSAGSGVKHAEFGNPDVPTRSVTIWLKPRTMNKAPLRATGQPVEKDGWRLIAAERDAPLIVEQDARVRMRHLAAGERLSLAATPGRLVYLATVKGEVVTGDERLSTPERIILHGGEITISSVAGATVVAVDVPVK